MIKIPTAEVSETSWDEFESLFDDFPDTVREAPLDFAPTGFDQLRGVDLN